MPVKGHFSAHNTVPGVVYWRSMPYVEINQVDAHLIQSPTMTAQL